MNARERAERLIKDPLWMSVQPARECLIDMLAELDKQEKTVENAISVAESNIQDELASGGKSCHWCMDNARFQAAREAVEMMKLHYPKSGCYRLLLSHFGLEEE